MKRFTTLDGYRGVAALAVACLHLGLTLTPSLAQEAYLAVDLFFGISGFVLARAYEPQFAKGVTPSQFIANRIARLAPLYLLGATLGVLCGAVALIAGAGELNAAQYMTAAVTALIMLPSPSSNPAAHLYPLIIPAWSLLIELLVNIAFAYAWRWLRAPLLVAIIAFSGAGLVALGLSHQSLDIGPTWGGLPGGLVRGIFAFSVGVLISRLPIPRASGSALTVAGVAAVGAGLVFLPPLPLVADLMFVLLGVPLIILSSARWEPPRWAAGAFLALGEVSYALYTVHYPIAELLHRAASVLHLREAGWGPALIPLGLATSLVAAWIATRFLDKPIRTELSLVRSGLIRRRSTAAGA